MNLKDYKNSFLICVHVNGMIKEILDIQKMKKEIRTHGIILRKKLTQKRNDGIEM